MFFVDFIRRFRDKHGQKVSFLILFYFLAAFVVARTYAVLYLIFGAPVVVINGIHVHHLNFGIFFLVISGFLGFYLSNSKWRRKIIAFYGIGLGLTFDEFGMWLHLEDHYWIRTSYDAIIIISAILLNAIFFGGRWVRVIKRIFMKADIKEKRSDVI
jgi:hypothetical protein